MPIPKPKKDETKKDFLKRCMADDVMVKEYPDEDQRYVICNKAWKEKKEKKSMNKKIEMRSYPIELRIDDSDEKPKIHGYAALFNELSLDLGGFKEKIKRGAFAKTIQESDIVATKNHDKNLILGRNKSGTLILKEDRKGLNMEIDPPETSYARDLIVSMKRGDIDQCSFAFKVIQDKWNNEDKNNIIRTLIEAELHDVSIVADPAYPQTKAQYRSTDDVLRDFNENLQEKEKLDEHKARRQELKAKIRKVKTYIIKQHLNKKE